MRTGSEIRRVILVVLDGLRPDAIARFDLVHPATILWALGVDRPADLEGRVLHEAFESCVNAPIASAVA